MKKQVIISIIWMLLLISLFLVVKPSSTEDIVVEEKKDKLGYCPTMQEEAVLLSHENSYELIKFDSASEVLFSLKNNKIDLAIIGRKAKNIEISSNIKETILKSGYTLVSNRRAFIPSSELSSIEIYSHLEMNFSFPVITITRNDIFSKINKGEIVLISWEDWNDNFEIIVVMDNNEKIKKFRGAFLYEN